MVKLHLALGDMEILNGFQYQWVHLKGVKQNGESYALWALVDNWPGFPGMQKNIRTARYIFQEGNGPAREYVHKITGEALLPEHRKWDILFPVNRGEVGLPFTERIHYLGHDFELTKTDQGESVYVPGAERMLLLPEVSVGTGRKVRDTEGARIYDDFEVPNKTEYTYQDYTRKDMEELMGAGVNLFWVTPEQYEWAKDWPVFCVHPKSDDRYPEMLYRSNMLGGHAYYDEPGFRAKNEILRGNAKSRAEATQFTINLTKESRRPYFLHDFLDTREDVDLGDLDLSHPIPAWETIISTGWQ